MGHSSFKVDIGVVDNSNNEKYILGILLDGPVYAASGTTTSREVSQLSMLKGFGWNIVRIWSLEWWENPDSVFEKLVALIKNSENKEHAAEQEPSVESAEITEPVEEQASEDANSGPEVFIYGQESADESEDTEKDQISDETVDSEDQAQKKRLI